MARRSSCSPRGRSVTAPITYGCSPNYLRLQPQSPAVAAPITYGCSPICLRLLPQITYGCTVVLPAQQVARAYAVVEGVATNNDGARKGGFSQPSEAAQV